MFKTTSKLKVMTLFLSIALSGCAFDVIGSKVDSASLKQDDLSSTEVLTKKGVSFRDDLLPMFAATLGTQKCTDCHKGTPAIGNLNLNIAENDEKKIYDSILYGRVDKVNPSDSSILTRPSGLNHNKFFEKDDVNYKLVSDWVAQGAAFEAVTITIPKGDNSGKPVFTPTPTPTPGPKSFFELQIYSKLGSCAGCHQAAPRIDLNDASALVLCNSVKAFAGAVNTASATQSSMYTKPTNIVGHQGGAIWSANNEGALIVQWINTKAASCTTP